MEENQVVEQKEITFGRIIKVAFRNWKLFTPIALVVAAGCALGIHFGYNTMKGSYSSTFSYSSVDLSQNKYADGSEFDYRTLVSSANLNAVKAIDEKYNGIDVEKILNNNGISVSKDDEKMTYTINLSYKYIKNKELARSFIKDVAESPLRKDADIVNNSSFNSALLSYDTSKTFEDQVRYLLNQAEFLTTSYNKIINTETVDGQTSNVPALPISVIIKATDNRTSVNSLIDQQNFIRTMTYRIGNGGFVLDYSVPEALTYYGSTKTQLEAEREENQKAIDYAIAQIKKLDTSGAVSSLPEDIQKLIVRNTDISYQIDTALDEKEKHKDEDPASVPGRPEFVAELTKYRSTLDQYTTDYKALLKAAYIDNAAVAPEKSSFITLNGTISLVINGVISVVVGVVVGAVVNLIVDRKKLYE